MNIPRSKNTSERDVALRQQAVPAALVLLYVHACFRAK